MKICKVCGKEITDSGRRSYCSKECALEGNRINARGFARDPNEPKVLKCKMCGKEFVKEHAGQKFCHWRCQKQYQKKQSLISRLIHRVAKKYNFEIKNEDKIVRAKMLLFRNDDMKRCPCASGNPNKYCGSALCIAETIYKGHCCCNMFHAKKTLQDYENGL
jgi:predicted nucleic acid-binding Zn ribbon protein